MLDIWCSTFKWSLTVFKFNLEKRIKNDYLWHAKANNHSRIPNYHFKKIEHLGTTSNVRKFQVHLKHRGGKTMINYEMNYKMASK